MKKHDQPYMPFFIGDWKKAPEIQSLSLEARGLWIEMLFLMWESTEKGYLTINGNKICIEKLSRLVGISIEKIEKILLELEENNVYSKTKDGVIFSRRMVKDAEISLKRAKSANKRWKNLHGVLDMQNSCKTHANTHANTDNDIDIDNDIEITLLKDKEVKEKKEKKDKFIPPSKIEVQEYFFEKGYSGLSADRFYEGYHAADWHDSQGKKIRNWKQKAQHVWFKEENQIGYKKESTQKYGRQDITMEQLRQQAERIPLCEKSILDQISDSCKPISEQK